MHFVGALRRPQCWVFCLLASENTVQGVCAGSSTHKRCKTLRWRLKPTAAQGLLPGPQSKPSGSATRFAGGSIQSQCRAFLLAPCPATAQGIDACAVAQPRCNDLRWRLKPTTIQTTSLALQCSRSARRCCAYLTPVAAQCNEFMHLLSEFCCFFKDGHGRHLWSAALPKRCITVSAKPENGS